MRHEFEMACCRHAQGLWIETSRVITRNEPLCDGTPRHERGYRARVMMKNTDRAYRPGFGPRKAFLCVSGLFQSKSDAVKWMPNLKGE